jgi:hypothetical protein
MDKPNPTFMALLTLAAACAPGQNVPTPDQVKKDQAAVQQLGTLVFNDHSAFTHEGHRNKKSQIFTAGKNTYKVTAIDYEGDSLWGERDPLVLKLLFQGKSVRSHYDNRGGLRFSSSMPGDEYMMHVRRILGSSSHR